MKDKTILIQGAMDIEVEYFIRNLEKKETHTIVGYEFYTGILGSGDVFNREYDRIMWLQNQFHNLSEDMESIGTYCVCNQFQVPCIGIRIISNNELTNEKLDKEQAIRLQKLFIEFLQHETFGLI